MRHRETCRWTYEVDAEPVIDGVVEPWKLERGDYNPAAGPYKRFDCCVVEVANDGSLASTHDAGAVDQLQQACEAITQARFGAGAVVLVFVHGWHNNADWGNENFANFRAMLGALSLRESEFFGRRVVGVYLGWEGAHDPDSALEQLSGAPFMSKIAKALAATSFGSREDRAKSIGASGDLHVALTRLVHAAKGDGHGTPAAMAMIGHSMGGLILEHVCEGWAPPDIVPWPDVVLLVNPASSAEGTRQLQLDLQGHLPRVALRPDGGEFHFPRIISATSSGDSAIGRLFPLAKRLRGAVAGEWSAAFGAWPKSAGFTPDMHTHAMVDLGIVCEPPLGGLDFGQHWHQLRFSSGPGRSGRSEHPPHFRISVPHKPDDRYEHRQYGLVPRVSDPTDPMWIFQVPDAIVDDHGDIFNFAAASLFLGLIQVSGALLGPYEDPAGLFAEFPECPHNCRVHADRQPG